VMLDASHRPYLIEINKASGTNHGHFTFIQQLVENLFRTMLSAVPPPGESQRDGGGMEAALRQHAAKGDFELVYPSESHVQANSTHRKELEAQAQGGSRAGKNKAFATTIQELPGYEFDRLGRDWAAARG